MIRFQQALMVLWTTFWVYSLSRRGMLLFLTEPAQARRVDVMFHCLVALAMIMLCLMAERPKLFKLDYLTVMVLGFNGINFISLWLSPIEFESSLRVYGAACETVAVSVFVLICINHASDVVALFRKVGYALVCGTFVLTVMVLLSGWQPETALMRFGEREYVHPNTIGFMAAAASIFVLGYEWPDRLRLFKYPVLAAIVSVLLLSFSKTAILGAACGMLLLWSLSSGRQKVGQFMLVAALLFSVGPFLFERLYLQSADYLSDPHALTTLTGRTVIWQTIIDLSREHIWLGYGFETFREVLRYATPHHWQAAQAHNAYLMVLLQTGIIGLTAFSGIVLRAILRCLGVVRRGSTATIATLVSVMILILMQTVTEGAVGRGGPELGLLIALIAGVKRMSKDVQESRL
jgi:O-antigen ligase